MRKGIGHTAVSTIKDSDPLDLATGSQRELLKFCNFQQGSRYKDKYYLNGTEYIKHLLENVS